MTPAQLQRQLQAALAQYQAGRIGDAAAVCVQLRQLAPREAVVWRLSGIVALQQGRIVEAETHLRAALRLQPNLHEAWDNLGYALKAQGHAYRDVLRAHKLAVVGSATAQAAEELGWQATLVPERFLAEGLVDAMAMRSDVDGARMLYPAAEGARDILPAGLRALGADVDVIPVYRSAPDPAGQRTLRTMVSAGELDLVTVAAPSAVDALLAALPAEHARRLPVACIGPVTARAARYAGFPVKVESDSATTAVFVRSIVAAFSLSR